MTILRINTADLPESHLGLTGIRLVLQTKKSLVEGSDGAFSVELARALNRKGEEHWVGDAVHFHGDGRRFIYLCWVDGRGQMFGRIKLYLEQIAGLVPGAERAEVTISGTGKKGGPAFSTAIIVE